MTILHRILLLILVESMTRKRPESIVSRIESTREELNREISKLLGFIIDLNLEED